MAEIRTVTTLRSKRDEILSSIKAYERHVEQAKADLAHINAVLRLFEATGDPKDMPPPVAWPPNDTWQLAKRFGPPDVVVKSAEYKMPSEGQDQWWKPVTDIGITEPLEGDFLFFVFLVLGLIDDMKDAPLQAPTSKGGNPPLWILGHWTYAESNILEHLIKALRTRIWRRLRRIFLQVVSRCSERSVVV